MPPSVSDAEIAEMYEGSLNEAHCAIGVAVGDLLEAIRDVLPDWLRRHTPEVRR